MRICTFKQARSVLLLLIFTASSSCQTQVLAPVELHPALPFVSTALVRLQAPGQPWALFWGSVPIDEKADVCGYGGVNYTQSTVVHYDEVTRGLVKSHPQVMSRRVPSWRGTAAMPTLHLARGLTLFLAAENR